MQEMVVNVNAVEFKRREREGRNETSDKVKLEDGMMTILAPNQWSVHTQSEGLVPTHYLTLLCLHLFVFLHHHNRRLFSHNESSHLEAVYQTLQNSARMRR